MPDQGSLSDRELSGFGLIETLLWTREEGFFLLGDHLARLKASAVALGFVHDEARVETALREAAERCAREEGAERLRVRLVLQKDGAIAASATAIAPIAPQTLWRVALANRRFASSDPLLRHKTTRRELYEEELAGSGADEVLFLNEREEICEGARANVFLARAGELLTPPLACGLLPGTLRAHLLRQGRAREAVLRLSDLQDAEFYMGNSVRGLVRAKLA
jgi:4-amino-4-deoxychorismate lyase